MASLVSLHWDIPPSVLANATADYGRRLLAAIHELAQFFAQKIASYARQHARWQDRTGHARASLTGIATKTATGVVIILAGLAEYSIWLEVSNQGRFAIILESLTAHYGHLMQAIRSLIGGR